MWMEDECHTENKIMQKSQKDTISATFHSCNSCHNKKSMIITKQNSLPAQAPHERYLINKLSPSATLEIALMQSNFPQFFTHLDLNKLQNFKFYTPNRQKWEEKLLNQLFYKISESSMSCCISTRNIMAGGSHFNRYRWYQTNNLNLNFMFT